VIRALFIFILTVGLFQFSLAFGVSPDEMLDDPALEQRARNLSQELRCVVCQNQSIDDSDADLAKDLRVIVREQLLAGQSEAQIKSYLVDRYGEFILFRPKFSVHTLMLWIGPFVVLFLLLGGGIWFYRSRSKGVSALSDKEEQELSDILRVGSEEPK
jgi:cytochrome c-type biogenesis protein CcmH